MVTPKGPILATSYKAEEKIDLYSSNVGLYFNLCLLIITLDLHAIVIFKAGMFDFVAQ